MRILELKAARVWSRSQTAEIFAVTEDTVATWLRRTDEEGDHALVQTAEPVNRFPDFVGNLVRRLKTLCPAMGKKRIAQALARAGLHLGTTTVGRMLKQQPQKTEPAEEALVVDETASRRPFRARHPNHIWHVDLSAVPTVGGFWIPWVPFSQVQRWPFCWWVAVAIDQFSRCVIGFALFKKVPTSAEVCQFLERATNAVNSKPEVIVTDKGRQFFCKTYRRWCRRQGVKARFGAVGKHASIAILERFMRSMKAECTRRILVPLQLDAMRHELGCYATWFNDHRPHQALQGNTPTEVYLGSACDVPVLEPRPKWPVQANTTRAARIDLAVTLVEGRSHLPIVQLTHAA